MIWMWSKLGLVAALEARQAFYAMIAAHCIARLAPVLMIFAFPYIVDEGDAKGALYNEFNLARKHLGLFQLSIAVLTSITVGCGMLGVTRGITAFLTIACLAMLAGRYCASILGGVVGDFLGATVCVSELVVYIMAGFSGIDWVQVRSAASLAFVMISGVILYCQIIPSL
jgi:cobalamin synthase